MIFTTGLVLFLAAYLAMLAQDALDLPQAAWRVVLAAFLLGLGLMAEAWKAGYNFREVVAEMGIES